MASLPVGVTFKGALKCVFQLPTALEAHPGIGSAREQMVDVVIKGIDERLDKTGKEQELQAGVAALAKCMGFVASVFEPAEELICGTQPLRNVVKQLSLKVFKQLLESEGQQLQC